LSLIKEFEANSFLKLERCNPFAILLFTVPLSEEEIIDHKYK
jgi:hypothetical protein